MKTSRVFPALCLLLSIAGGGVADEPSAGFVALFNGKDLTGWEQMNGSKFFAEDGVIKHRQGMGWLRTTEQYDNFILGLQGENGQLEFRKLLLKRLEPPKNSP